MTSQLLALILSLGILQQPVQTENQAGSLHALLVASGMRATLGQADATFRTALDTLFPARTRPRLHGTLTICLRAFDADTLARQMLEVWEDRIPPETVGGLVAYYSQTPGKQIRQREEFLLTQKGMVEFRRYEEWLRTERPSYRRTLLLQRLEDNLQVLETLSRTLVPVVDSIAATTGPSGISGKALHQRVEKELKRMVESHWLFVFQHLSNDQLQSYNEFLERSESASFLRSMRQGLKQVLSQASEKACSEIGSPSHGGN